MAEEVLAALPPVDRARGHRRWRLRAGNRPTARSDRATSLVPNLGAPILEPAITPYPNRPSAKPPRCLVVDPYLRCSRRFINPNLELIQRGRGDVVVERIRQACKDYRGHAIEPLVTGRAHRRLAMTR